MDFPKVLETVTGFVEERGWRHALIGAFALAAYGLPRATQDLDFAVDAAAQGPLVAHLEALGYETLYRSSGYSNHVHPLPAAGRVDCIYVAEPTASFLFGDARAVPLFGRSVLVPRPEHLAAMKVLAMKNDPERTFQELADLQFIMGLPGVDRDEIRASFDRHGLKERYDELLSLLELP